MVIMVLMSMAVLVYWCIGVGVGGSGGDNMEGLGSASLCPDQVGLCGHHEGFDVSGGIGDDIDVGVGGFGGDNME